MEKKFKYQMWRENKTSINVSKIKILQEKDLRDSKNYMCALIIYKQQQQQVQRQQSTTNV